MEPYRRPALRIVNCILPFAKGPVPMNDDDSLACEATATGILQCLRMLAEEAASLQLTRTLVALRTAIDACASERLDPAFDLAAPSIPPRMLH